MIGMLAKMDTTVKIQTLTFVLLLKSNQFSHYFTLLIS